MSEFPDMAASLANEATSRPFTVDLSQFPTGTVTFLMSDVEGSTGLWEAGEDQASTAITRHYQVLHSVIAKHRGFLPLEQGEGDSVVGVFAAASDAVEAAFEILRAIEDESWQTASPLRVRLALHTGEAQVLGGGNYHGRTIIRCARLRAIAHGGQALVSDSTHDLAAERLPAGVSLRLLGVHRLKDLGRSERVWQLCHAGLTSDFPELRSLDSLPNNLPDATDDLHRPRGRARRNQRGAPPRQAGDVCRSRRLRQKPAGRASGGRAGRRAPRGDLVG